MKVIKTVAAADLVGVLGAALVAIGLVGFLGVVLIAALPSAAAAPQIKPASTKPAAKQYKIEDYTFEWLVAEQGKGRLRIIKDQDSIKVTIDRDFSGISVTPTEAEAIATALVNTEECHKRMRAAQKDISETVKAGKYNVHFRYSPKSGFDVWVRTAEAFGRSVWLDRKQALAFRRHLAEARSMAAYVDAKIRP